MRDSGKTDLVSLLKPVQRQGLAEKMLGEDRLEFGQGELFRLLPPEHGLIAPLSPPVLGVPAAAESRRPLHSNMHNPSGSVLVGLAPHGATPSPGETGAEDKFFSRLPD